MLKCHLSRIMGEKRLKISDVCAATGINRGTLTRLYYEKASRIELETLDSLCEYLGCAIGDLYEHISVTGNEAEAREHGHGG
ncbi:MAG: helix-turn-helix domain-containing protein [Acidithiobacillus sp.]